MSVKIDSATATLRADSGGAAVGERESVGAPTEVRVLGRFAVRTVSGEVAYAAFGGRLAQRLLRVLATRRGEVVARDVLTEALWPGRHPRDQDANLNVLVSRARGALGDRRLIVTGAAGYALTGDDRCRVDAERFLASAELGRGHLRAGRAGAALRGLRGALDLWGEPLPEDAYQDWAQPYRDRLAAVHQQVLEEAAQAALAVRDPAEAVAHARAALQLQPLGDVAARLLILALAEAGDRAASLTTYAAFRRRVVEELGVEPAPAVQELHERILRGELPATTVRSRVHVTVPTPRELPFVGRGVELATVLGALSLPRRPVIVAGRSGAGKSRLLKEVQRRSPLPVVSAVSFVAEQGRAFSLVRTVLREALALDIHAAEVLSPLARDALAEVVPELEDPGESRRLDVETRRSLRTEGAVRLLEAASADGLALLLDDLQWADPSSLALLERVFARVEQLRTVLAFRPEEAGPAHPVWPFHENLKRANHVAEVELDVLQESALQALTTDDKLASAIARGTDRSPLAVSEAITALGSAGLVSHDGRAWHRIEGAADSEIDAIVTAGQQRTITVRIGRQPARRRELLACLALVGRETAPGLLARALNRDQGSVLVDLDRLHLAALVRPAEAGWHTAHDLIGATVIENLEAGNCAELHRRLAASLSQEDGDAAEIGRHLAGAGDRRGAATAYAHAAQVRIDDHATEEARELAEAALACLPAHADRTALLEIRAEARARTDDLAGARTDLRAAIAGRAAGPDRARALARLAMLESGADDLHHAQEVATRALTESRSDPSVHAAALSVAAIIDMNLGHDRRATERADEALRLFSEVGDARGVADILDGRAMATFLDGRITDGVAAFDQVAHDFESQGELLRVITPRSTRGHGLLFMDRPREGLAEIDRALALARMLGHAEGITFAQWHRSEVLAALGQLDEGQEAATEALEIAHRLDHRGWTATALLGVGTIQAAAEDTPAAATTFRNALQTAHGLPLFASWAAARLGLVMLKSAHLAEAADLAARASSHAPGLARYEVDLLTVAVAIAAERPQAAQLRRTAMHACHTGGHHRVQRAIATLTTDPWPVTD